ncbi:hypothetical protein GIB67_032625 [Kingdonia uniflora]|uniref:Exostosin GT47 domain-containing protein n=1 Tax=Kingdonia uniflora TaxID=39325 RepID=A0A7J7P9N6_9MAGN|nr:hypothetical protein GIB67_032625 [Kingdonia uniflora]
MIQTPFKIYIYQTSSLQSLFHSSLLKTPFVTTNPQEAHLFYIPFPLDTSPRSISRVIRYLRNDYPFWNQTLGADHFFVFCDGIGYESDRNLVELKKNSLQLSCFPSKNGNFIPHKDLTLPPLVTPYGLYGLKARFRGYFNGLSRNSSFVTVSTTLFKEMKDDNDFVVEHVDGDELSSSSYGESKFCLFLYGDETAGMFGIGEALRLGCVPVIISDRPVIELPFMDVLRWSKIAMFVGLENGVKELKSVLDGGCGEKYEEMRRLGKIVSKHFDWSGSVMSPQPFDAFHTVLYQLWLRRHTIRYARREIAR